MKKNCVFEFPNILWSTNNVEKLGKKNKSFKFIDTKWWLWKEEKSDS